MKIEPGLYRHFKGGVYEVLCTATHTETDEELVIYRPLYGARKTWARPASMWAETVKRGGYCGPRFMPISKILESINDESGDTNEV